MAANPYEYVFDVIGILKAGGILPVAQIEERFQQLKGDLVTRRRETIRRILQTGHDRGVFFKREKRSVGGFQVTASWGYTSEEFSQPDMILESNLGGKWTGTLPQRQALIRYDHILSVQERTPKVSLEEIADRAGVSRSLVTRAGSFFQVSSPGAHETYYFSSRAREAILTQAARYEIVDKLQEGATEQDVRSGYSLTAGEYRRLTQFREALETPASKIGVLPSLSR